MLLKMLASCTVLLALTGVVAADPLAPASVPEGAKWVIHVNVDAIRGTAAWELVRTRFVEPNRVGVEQRLHIVETLTGVKLQQDLHDVTLFGTSYDDGTACIIIHAPIDQKKLTGFLEMDPEFTTQEYHGHTVLTWRDKDRDRLMYGSFMAGERAVASPNLKCLELSLDTADGKSPGVGAHSPLAPVLVGAGEAVGLPAATAPGQGSKDSPAVWMAGVHLSDLPRLQRVESPFLSQMEDAAVGVMLSPDKVTVKMAVTASSEKTAQQLSASGEGLKAMIALSAADERALPRVKMLASVLQNLTLSTEGKTINVECAVSMEKIDMMAEMLKVAQASGAIGGPQAVPLEASQRQKLP